MNDFSYWMLFISVALLMNIIPGPDMLYLISKTISQGRKVGIATVLGLGTGALVHTLFAVMGISVIIATSALAFDILKYVGAGYLFYLGVKALFSGGIKLDGIEVEKSNQSCISAFYQAILIDVLNPKVAIFFMAFLPQFYRENSMPRMLQFLILGLIIILIGFIVETIIVFSVDKISSTLKKSSFVSKALDKAFGTILIGLGIRLVLEKSK